MAATNSENMTTAADIESAILDGPPYFDEGKPFLTMGDIADEIGVTKETVRNNTEKAEAHPLIHVEKVGQAKVFWKSFRPDSEGVEDLSEQELQRVAENERDLVVTRRALWLHNAQILLDATANDGGPSAEQRADAWEALVNYLIQVGNAGYVSIPVALSKIDIPEPYSDAHLPADPVEGELLPEWEDLHSSMLDVPLFEGEPGVEVKGITMLYVYHHWLVDQIENPEAADEYLPSASEITFAGQLLDRFVVRLTGFDW